MKNINELAKIVDNMIGGAFNGLGCLIILFFIVMVPFTMGSYILYVLGVK